MLCINNIMTEQEYQHNNQQEDNNNYYYNAHGAGRTPRTLSPEEGETIKQAYFDNISETMSGAVAHMLEEAFKNGLTAREIGTIPKFV